ncbi:MAG: FG-GAP-like repeat-containing protein, partial [Thermoanaerobaculia bacterium]
TYRNDRGKLVPSREMPVGQSPRELVAGDFNLDGQVDFAVINRVSADLSLLPGVPGEVGFGSLDQIYLVDGQVVAFDLSDFNHDGRADVVQLHQGSGDVSVRLARPDGTLAPPEFYVLGNVPADLRVQDVNNDGRNDLVAVNFGRPGIEKGSVSVRLGRDDGTFAPEARYELPPLVTGNLFAVVVADFNGDGNVDLAAGYSDCRVSFFRGTGDGGFVPAGDHDHVFFLFGYEIRAMATGDFDRDGDIDLAGAIMSGEYIVVAENPGSLLGAKELKLHRFGPQAKDGWSDAFPTLAMVPVDLNRDGDIDLVVGTGAGTLVFLGGPGIQFTATGDPLPGTVQVPSSSVTTGDLDGDGDDEIVVSCKVLSCIIVLTKDAAGKHVPALVIDVPSGQFVAVGDIDGDGHLDLAGTGDVLWTALSSRRAKPSGPPVLEGLRERMPRLVINELMAVNNALPLLRDGGRRSDWIELYNGADRELSLTAHRLVLEPAGEAPREYRFPPDARLAGGAHLLVVAGSGATPYHTGFKIPGTGGVLKLLDSTGAEVDRVPFGPQEENVSYARYRDGLSSFVLNPYPSPERPNADNGSVEPLASLLGASAEGMGLAGPPRPIRPGEAIRFFAQGKDDVFLMNLSIMARRLDFPDATTQRIILY